MRCQQVQALDGHVDAVQHLPAAADRRRCLTFVREVMANMADRQRWWQRIEELLSVAGAVPGLAVILQWARRRRA